MQSHGTEQSPLSRDEVLVWLNDRLGRSFHVSVELEKGDYGVSVLAAEGVLRHWREDDPAWINRPRPDLIGWYGVGGSHFDLSDLDHLDAWLRLDVDGVDLDLGADVTLRIVEQVQRVSLEALAEGGNE